VPYVVSGYFPPFSSPNLIGNMNPDPGGGIITITFSEDVTSVGAYVTGSRQVAETIHDAGGSQLGSVITAGPNFGDPNNTDGLSPNIFLNLTGVGIRSVSFVSLRNFTLDNLTFSPTPLPAALPLFASGLGVMGLLGWRRKRKKAAALAAV
jgi:PEP-CTERM motif